MMNKPETEGAPFDVESELNKILAGDWQERLAAKSFEAAEESLAEVRALREWRKAAVDSEFSSFYQLFEAASALNRAGSPNKSELIAALTERLSAQLQALSPRVADMYATISAKIDGSQYAATFESTQLKTAELEESGDLELLTAGSTPYTLKADRMQTRLEGELLGRRALDRRDRRLSEGDEREAQPSAPPSASDESKPGMNEMERNKEGENPPAIWTISPARGGYFKQQSFDSWDNQRNTWTQSQYDFIIMPIVTPSREQIDNAITISTEIPAKQWVRLPLPYNFDVISRYPQNCNIKADQHGDCIVYLENGGRIDIKIAPTNETKKHVVPESIPSFETHFSADTISRLAEISGTKKGNLAQARAVAGWTRRRLKYSNDSSFNQIYDTHQQGYIGAIEEHRQADCDVANTYFAALCSALDIPVRHVVGHSVKGKDGEGNSRITGGTGHAWSEIWDETKSEWVRVDATPAGDPQLEEREGETGEPIPGDYGEQEAVGPSDEYLAELEEKLSELTEKLSYSDEERQLAEAAGVELSEARQIVKEIAEAEDTRLPNGQRVVDLLSQLFSLIVEARRTTTPDYTGPLRKREGGEEIDDIVAHKIGSKAGEIDPRSRQKPFERQAVEQVFGGFDLYMIGDKSGSMSDTVDDEAKWQIQRRAEYLIFSALHRFEQNLQRANMRLDRALSVRSQGISFRNSDEIDQDRPLSSTFSAVDKVKLWRSLGNQGSGNGDVTALSHVLGQIKAEREETEEQHKTDNRLRIVIACSDGYPDNEPAVKNLAGQLGQLNAVVVGLGLTETAAAVPAIFTTETSRGEVVKDINHLPAVVAKNVILEATRLFPEKSKKSVDKIVTSILDKFDLIN